jgi:hypothetical protein
MAYRTFPDTRGRVWDVWDVHPFMIERRISGQHQAIDAERRQRHEPRVPLPRELHDGWLTFESRGERRRLVLPPSGWGALADAELVKLLERAVVTGKARRLIE